LLLWRAGSQKGSHPEYGGSHDAGFFEQAPGPGRGRGLDLLGCIQERYVGAVSLGFSPSGARIRKKVTGRTKTEVRDKLRELHRQALAGLCDRWNTDRLAKLLEEYPKRRNSYYYYNVVAELDRLVYAPGRAAEAPITVPLA
jgi:hypothetical protein